MAIQIGITSLAPGDRVEFFRTLAGWLSSGNGQMPLSEAVSNTCDAFAHDKYKTLKPKMDNINQAVHGGQVTLAAALAQARLGFTAQELAIIRAAEQSSQLRAAVPALADALDMQHKGRKNLMMQLSMPLAVGLMLIVMTLGVLIFMLPMVIGPVLKRRPEALEEFPAIIQGYWHASVWLNEYYMVPSVLLVGLALTVVFRNNSLVRPYVQKFNMWFTPVRRLIISFNSVLVVYFMPALVRSGMPLPRVLFTLADCIANPQITAQLKVAAEDHERGIRLGSALATLPFRASFVNAVIAGEQTGAIAERVDDLKEPYKIELERQIRQFVGTIKFLVMAVLLPFFIVSTYTALVGPIFGLLEYK